MRLLVTGSSGFIGRAVVSHFEKQGAIIVKLQRGSQGDVCWEPDKGKVHLQQLEGFDAIIHLAGDNVSNARWTKKKKEAIFTSRCRDTWLLAQSLMRLKNPPKIFLSASAVGLYGNRGEETLTEQSLPGQGFLADVCVQWEAASRCLQDSSIRVIRTRFGAVMSAQGGFLAKAIPIFRLGLGGRLGNGKQWLSWIALSDLVRALDFVLQKGGAGAYNFTSPEPVRNTDFTNALASFLHRPAICPVPAFVLRLGLGEMADGLILSSAKAIPQRLLAEGFEFEKPSISQAFS